MRVEGCYAEVKQATAGIRLCKLHAVKEEKPKSARTVRVPKPKAAPPSPVVVEEEDPAEEVEVVQPRWRPWRVPRPDPPEPRRRRPRGRARGLSCWGCISKQSFQEQLLRKPSPCLPLLLADKGNSCCIAGGQLQSIFLSSLRVIRRRRDKLLQPSHVGHHQWSWSRPRFGFGGTAHEAVFPSLAFQGGRLCRASWARRSYNAKGGAWVAVPVSTQRSQELPSKYPSTHWC